MILIGFLVGAVLGSFAKALADRSLQSKSFKGRSYCEKCKHTLFWYDLFPVFSYLILRGKCRYCKKAVSLEYLIVEVVMGALVGYLFYQSFQNFQFAIYNYQFFQTLFEVIFRTFFVTVLAALFLTDIKEMFIPDRIVVPSIIIATVLLLGDTIFKITYLYNSLRSNAIGQYLLPPHSEYFTRHALMAAEPFTGAAVAGLSIAFFFFCLVSITKGRGMGGGDIKLGLFLGLGLGFPAAFLATILGFVSGAVIALGAVLAGKKGLKSQIPFGPFLIFGSLVSLFWGSQIIEWYLRIGT